MAWHPEILARQQMRVLAQIGPWLTRRGFYLGGGTAVALHLGHRRSVDLDWFGPELPDPELLGTELREQGVALVTGQVAPGTLHGTVRGVQVSLLRYRYPLLAGLRPWPGGVRIASRADLAAMKLLAAAQRGAKKDFVDIYALGKRACSLQKMLQWYQQKYATEDVAHLLFSLSFFRDAEKERLPRMLWKVNWRTVKETIQRWVKNIPR